MDIQYKVKYIVGSGVDLLTPLSSGVGAIHAGIAYDVTPIEYSRLMATGHYADATEKAVATPETAFEKEVPPALPEKDVDTKVRVKQ